jgi:glyoxylase-like metal-dependent hydrolase (beta-lactamase superfamily II)/rhodanese-related sulfurtransferase
MKVEQIYTGCLAEAAYYIESNGEVAIIDPLRESAPYIDRASANNANIKYVLETHFHADFVSGHIDLARKTGAKIVFGPTAKPNYDAYVASDGEILKLGNVTIKVLHTPGHTLESTTYLLKDESGKDYAIFTGDTLFIGDVGRPDLVQKVKADITPQYLAGLLFDSLRNKIMTLGDEVIVYPGHGAGSACGKKMDKDTISTVGKQKKFNYALRADMTREEFIKEVTEGLVEPPQYFPSNVLMNVLGGIESIDVILQRGNRPLTPKEFQTVWEAENALVIDARTKDEFPKEFIPGSIYVGIDDSFAPWVGTLVTDLKQPILFVADEGREEEVVTRLARVGYDHTLGYLKGGIKAWREAGNEVDAIEEITPEEFAPLFDTHININVLDVRRKSEYDAEHLVGVENFPLDFINRNMSMLDNRKKYFLHCAGGYRSVIAASILKARGFEKVVNIKGGYKALSQTSLARTDHKEVNTEL